jgi:tRNA threonylcarbamoyl adenosine modification protein YeaZ
MDGAAMSVLAIDTSSRQRTVVVIATSDGTLRRSDVRTEVPVGAAVPESIAALLEPEVTAVVVVAGPGSYTGLRAGMAAALGIAHARDLPLFGVGTLDVVAAGQRPSGKEHAWAAADAGRGAVYLAECEPQGDGWRAGPAVRVALAGLNLGGLIVLSADHLELTGAVAIDPAVGLARAVPGALQRPALSRDGIRATYVE